MKTLICLFATAMLLFAGCAKEGVFSDNAVKPDLKKANVPIPFRVELCGVPDMESEFKLLPIPGLDPTDPANYYATRMFFSGIITHVGNVNSERSYTEIETMVFIIENGSPFLVQSGTGKIVAANGDSYEFTNWVKTSLPGLSYTCGSEIIPGSGTGRFEGISGSTIGIGQVDRVNQTNCWTADGKMEYQ